MGQLKQPSPTHQIHYSHNKLIMITIIATTTHPKENNSGISKVEFFTLDIVFTTDIYPKYIYLLFLGIVTYD